jgi:hypothetical protein
MKKVVRLTERDLTRLVKRVINEQADSGFETYKKGITDLITSNGFTKIDGYTTPTYEKNLGERGIAYFIVRQYKSAPYVLSFFKNPSSDIIKSFGLKPTGDEDPGIYTDAEGIANRGYGYYNPAVYKTLEDTVAYKQITQTILPKIK